MKIYIDESGSFAEKQTIGDSWNVIAALSIPDRSQEKLNQIMESLRKSTGVEEPKISDLKSNRITLDTIREISKLDGTLFATIINRSKNESKFHSEVCEIDSRHEYQSYEIKNSTQLQLQHNLLFELMNATFFGTYIRYKSLIPEEIAQGYHWIIDNKSKKFNETTRNTINRWLHGEYSNYHYRITNNIANNDSQINTENYFSNILFCNSKDESGIQLSGVLAGAIRGCLMEKYGNLNDAISRALGKLMMKKPKTLSIKPNGHEGIKNKSDNLIPIFDKFSSNEVQSRSLIMMRHNAKKYS